MTNPRDLIKRLADALHEAAGEVEGWGNYASSYFQEKHDLRGNVARIYAEADEARAYLAQPEPDASQLSDGYHTFAELYEHRHALCLALMRAMPQHWWFSWRHADGELCFGGNDWFIVGAELPGGDSVTYHLPAELYPVAVATGAYELREGRPWDGHNAADVVTRLKKWAALSQPEPEGPTDEELLATAAASIEPCQDTGIAFGEYELETEGAVEMYGSELIAFARAVLARWGK
jgi:hypothetical protein